MPTKIITVKKVYKKEGTTKNGKPYVLTKFLDNNRTYYTTFQGSSIIDSIKEGSEVNMEYESSGREGSFNIKRIISVVEAKDNPYIKRVAGVINDNLESMEAKAEQATANNFLKAKDFIDREVPNASAYQDYLGAIIEYSRQLNNNQWLVLEKAKLGVK